MNVLIVDDNATGRKLLRAVLEPDGYRVIEAVDGRDALTMLEGKPVDAVISDLLMPNLDGYRLCREIRQDERWRNLPFIFYTATYTSPGDEKLAFELGADAYLRKPTSTAILLETLRAVTQKPARREGEASHTEMDVLHEYSQRLVIKLQEKNLELEQKNRLAELAAEVGVTLTRRDTLRDILQACAASVLERLDAALVCIWTLDDNESTPALQARAGTGAAEVMMADEVRVNEAFVAEIVRARQPCLANGTTSAPAVPAPAWARRTEGWAFAGYPLIVGDRLLGVLAIFSRQELSPATHAALAAIADSLALGIQNKWAEQVLRESEERFRQLAETINEAFWMTDPARTHLLYVSPAYEAIWGRPCASFYAAPQSWLEAVHPEDRERVRQAALACQAEGTYDQEYRVVRPDGAVRWVRDRAFPVRDAAGRVIRIAGVAEDVTERRDLEMQLRQAQKMEAVGQLAGGVAHDFNNLLLVILGHSELLALEPSLNAACQNSAAEISRAAERAAALTRQLLVFSRQQVVEPTILDLNELIADVERMLRRLIGEDLRLQTTLQPGPSLVRVDAGQMEQVIMNLAVNARDAMPNGGQITIETRTVELNAVYARGHPGVRPGRYVLLAVTDTGSGMSPEVQARIFEPFFTTKPVGQGTGLGLSVVHGIVKQSGGHIEVYSLPGVGTTFKIHLPAVTEGEAKPASQGVPVRMRVGGNETILLVEDEEPVRTATALLLRNLGYRVLEAAGGEQALRVASGSERVDLLLTDVVMPGMSGRELADALRQRQPQVRVLFQTGYAGEVADRHGVPAEGTYLQKPFRLDTLARKVRESLGRPRGMRRR